MVDWMSAQISVHSIPVAMARSETLAAIAKSYGVDISMISRLPVP
jgi:hypothetical protein